MLPIYFVILVSGQLCKYAQGYDTNENYLKYGGYGSDWMFFPDANGNPTVGLLKTFGPFNPFANVLYDVEKSVNFTLYTRDAPQNGQLLEMNERVLSRSFYNHSKPTKFIVHGWLSRGTSDTCITIKDSYLRHYDYNVIIIDWSEIAGNIFYPIPMSYTHLVGEYYAKFVDFLIEQGTSPSNLHLIGHSLGAHISGFAGLLLTKGNISRVTGLDPAFPGFKFGLLTGGRISTSSAEFVDIIHSCAGVLGLAIPVGDADFYPNNGMPPQPGCEGIPEVVEACSHGRSWQYFRESIGRNHIFLSKECSSWFDYERGNCAGFAIPMGDSVPHTASGTFYLRTNSKEPFFMEDSKNDDAN